MSNELNELKDITDELVFEEEPELFSEEHHAVDLIETAFHLIEEYMKENPTIITEPNFHEIVLDEIKELMYIQFEQHFDAINGDYLYEDIDTILEYAFEIFITTFHPEKSTFVQPDYNDIYNNINNDNNTHKNDNTNTDIDTYLVEKEKRMLTIEETITRLRCIEQPKQRTPEWYEFRNNLITASNAYKAFESVAMVNQLIYEKCQPINYDNKKFTNINSPLHWGQKYEPLSVTIYEKYFNTTVEDFGCLKHPIHSFLGASPDGINVDKTSPKYGRMLEIKNVVSRVINGIPKKEYWIQMQLQMEVCDLDECDFLETKFTEYSSYNAFENDDEYSLSMQSSGVLGKIKGLIIHFHNCQEDKPFYVYKPLDIVELDSIEIWQNNMIELYTAEPFNYSFIKYICWKLEVFNCILVSRNKEWFKNNIGQLGIVWKTIETERITGYEHRAPKKNQCKNNTELNQTKSNNNTAINDFFLKVVKLDHTE